MHAAPNVNQDMHSDGPEIEYKQRPVAPALAGENGSGDLSKIFEQQAFTGYVENRDTQKKEASGGKGGKDVTLVHSN